MRMPHYCPQSIMRILPLMSLMGLPSLGAVFKLSTTGNNGGVLIAYMIIIGNVLSGTSSDGIHHAGVLESWFGQQWWNNKSYVLLFTTLGVFAPLASLKRMDSLSSLLHCRLH